ncbi:MAG: RNA polymerase subunit sigma-24 [Verrucomicrobia bacterium]|nr:RNA polymerase subunit sigma-24 [Verrucomicrobiota bacterium]
MDSTAFPLTRWSVVAALGTGADRSSAERALGELCRSYWYPLYAFARRSGLGPPDAEDATQSFFAAVLEERLFAAADPSIGRLRSFLLKAFSRDLADTRRRERRQRRGGGTEHIPLEAAEERFLGGPASAEPALEFEAAWATAVLEGALGRVAEDYRATGRGELFEALRPALGSGQQEPADSAQLAVQLGLQPPALRQAVTRLRQRFRAALREQIADTLREPSEEAIDDELRALQAVLRRG